jgi:hypothetical protein
MTSVKYLLDRIKPVLNDELYRHCEIVDVTLRTSVDFNSVMYVINRSDIFPTRSDSPAVSLSETVGKLQIQFCDYQTATDLPENDRADMQWFQIAQMKDSMGQLRFNDLAKVMSFILCIPQSNADCERVFSFVRKTRTDQRTSMSDKTLESLLLQKVNSLHGGPCYAQKFSDSAVQKAKSATYHLLNGGPPDHN